MQASVEKNGIRSIERITGHHRIIIGQLIEYLSLHVELVNSILLQDVNLDNLKLTRWTFVKKTKER